MERKTKVEFISSWAIVIVGAILMVLPLFGVVEVEKVFLGTMLAYVIINVLKNYLTIVAKDYTGFLSAGASLIVIILMIFLKIEDSPWNLALTLFIWIIMMSLIKLKKSDYYNDRKNKLWKLNVINLILFIISGVLTTLNLNYTGDVQIIILGAFLLINGILELMTPLCSYLLEKN